MLLLSHCHDSVMRATYWDLNLQIKYQKVTNALFHTNCKIFYYIKQKQKSTKKESFAGNECNDECEILTQWTLNLALHNSFRQKVCTIAAYRMELSACTFIIIHKQIQCISNSHHRQQFDTSNSNS